MLSLCNIEKVVIQFTGIQIGVLLSILRRGKQAMLLSYSQCQRTEEKARYGLCPSAKNLVPHRKYMKVNEADMNIKDERNAVE